MTTRGTRKTLKGTVVSAKMDKTVVVQVDTTMRHPRYDKVVKRAKRYYAHNEQEGVNVGDAVTIMETRPMSKLKRWRVVSQTA